MRLQATATFRPRSDLGRFVESRITPAVRASVAASCKLIQDAAQRIVPVDTGALRESITVEIDDSGKTVRGVVGPHTHYAAYVEFGTGIAGAASPGAGSGPYNPKWPGMPAQPYMRPALDENKSVILDVFRSEIAAAIEK